jgi:hypothetical protein
MFYRILRDAAAGDGGGTAATKADDKGKEKATPPDPSEGFKLALKKHGDDATAFARTLYLDHEKTRAELDAARGKMPKDGSLILDPEAAKGWAELTKAHKPEDIAKALADLSEAQGKIAATARKDLLNEVATKAVGSDNRPLNYDPDVLAELLKDGVIEFKEVTAFGKTLKQAVVVESTTDANGKPVETRTILDKYAAAKWAKFLPSLKASSGSNPQGQRQTNVPPTMTGNANGNNGGVRPGMALRMPRV